jgi:hypothetical protein
MGDDKYSRRYYWDSHYASLASDRTGGRAALRRIGEHDPHPKFGPQIKVETFEAITPSKAAGTEAHLARPSALRNSGLRQ